MKLVLVLAFSAITAHAAPSDPGTVAIGFLEKVRLGKINLDPGGDTALSAQTAESKKRRIAKTLERMSRDLGSDALEVGSVKTDEGLAAVLIRKVGGFDPSRLQVFPVALVKRGTEWSPAPVLASFENSGTGHALDLRERIERLENWMLRTQIVDLEQLREQSAARLRDKIETKLHANELKDMDANECATLFLEACEKGDLPSILGFMGGLSAELPDDWPQRLQAAERAIAAGKSAPRPWRLLTSSEVVRAFVGNDSDESGAFISVACLDPAGSGATSQTPRIELIHFEIKKTDDGLWQVDPPPAFLQSPKDPDAQDEEEVEDGDFDRDLMNAFPAAWIKDNPLKPQPEATQAHQAFIEALGSGELGRILAISKIDDVDGETARRACIKAAEVGWSVQNPNLISHAMPLAFKQVETAAAAIFQFFSARDPDRFEPRTIFFEKSERGWLWSPLPSADTEKTFKSWADSESREWRDQWQESLLEGIEPQTTIDSLSSPSKEDARLVVEEWLRATRSGDLQAILKLVTRLNQPKSKSTLLQNLGYEINGLKRSATEAVITGVYQGDTWAAVGVSVETGGKTSHPLYPVLQTSQGPRIMLEIDLFAAANRSRDFLNRVALERLKKSTATAEDMEKLYREHQIRVQTLTAESIR